jgi:hypothetical protein
MSTTRCTWEKFKSEAATLRLSVGHPSVPVLFRGQSSAKWDLETTLERSDHSEDVAEYFRLILSIKPEIEISTQLKWSDSPSLDEIESLARNYDAFSRRLGDFPHYAYMAYLRHHGFPTPLLDWSTSPFVAAYFAFEAATGDPGSEVAIYAYTEMATAYKTYSSDEAQIHRFGSRVAAHKRHFAQQSEYTICTEFRDNQWSFTPHSAVFDDPSRPKQATQDVLHKFTLSILERSAVLRELNDYNLNAFSLFGSEEGLLKALSVREELRWA